MGNQRILFEPGCCYHIYNHGNGDDNIFQKEENYYNFLMKYWKYFEPLADTYAYCLMPNHFHLMIRLKDVLQLPGTTLKKLAEGEINYSKLISSQFSHFLNAYVKRYNIKYGRKGSLFLDNIQRKKVEDEGYFTKLIHYIHYNPVHHGFASNVKDWPYSSYNSILSPAITSVNRKEVLDWFGSRKNFIEIHNGPLD